jgi:streptogramin lyase
MGEQMRRRRIPTKWRLGFAGLIGALVAAAGCGGGSRGSGQPATYQATFRELGVPVAGNDPTQTPGGSWPDDLKGDSNGNVWLVERHSDEIGCFSRSGVYRGFPVATHLPQMDSITVDDARQVVWVTEVDGNKLARVDISTGQVTEIPVPTANAVPGDLAISPDSTIWFTEGYEGVGARGRLAHLDPVTNHVTEISPPAVRGAFDGIAVSPDGSVWLVEIDDNRIAHFAGGQFTEFALPRANAVPTNIAIDSHGRIWVTEQVGNAIARYDPAVRAWSEIPIPTTGGQPSGITIDARDNVWFTEFGPGKIGVIPAAAGQPVDFLIPTPNSGPEDIYASPDGAIFFTEQFGNKVGQIAVPGLTLR